MTYSFHFSGIIFFVFSVVGHLGGWILMYNFTLFFYFGPGPAKPMQSWTLDFLCMLGSPILCTECAVAEIYSWEGLHDRAVQPSPYHSGLTEWWHSQKLSGSHPSQPDTGPYCYPGSYISKGASLMHRNVDESFIVIVGYGPMQLILKYIHVFICYVMYCIMLFVL